MKYEAGEKGLRLWDEAGEVEIVIEAVREDIIRVRQAREKVKDMPSFLVEENIREREKPEAVIREEEGKIFLGLKKLTAEVSADTGIITWRMSESGKKLLTENGRSLVEKPVYKYTTGEEAPVIDRVKTVDGERNFIKNLKKVEDRKAYRGKLNFLFDKEEKIYGLGQAEEGIYNLRHHTQYLYQHNMRIPMPMFYSGNGYGVFVDCTSLMTFTDDENGSYLFLDTVEQIDYYVIAGLSPDEVIDGFRFLTGKAAMLPKWAYGYIQSKEQYYTAKELEEVIARYRALEVPIDCVVQDWNSWEPGNWGEKILDQERYGDMEACAERIHQMHAHTMISVWPNMNSGGKNHTELMENGCMLNDYATYDAFSEKGRSIYWRQAKEGLFDKGFDSWWCDSTEPFSGPDWGGEEKREPWERYMLVGEEHKKYLDAERANIYALMHARGICENQRRDCEEKRVLNLTRSGYASGQKYGAVLWSGDITASWETMKRQITEGLNMGLSGYPYWTLDIGGFFTVHENWQGRGCGCHNDPTPKWFWRGDYEEGVKDAGYRELYVRWLEMGTFLPMFRSHGTDTPREIWNFGEKGTPFYDAIEKFIKLRYQLMPYIYSLAGAVRLENGTIMRSLFFDFGEDKKTYDIKDEFLFGKNILVCPVTEPMYYLAGNRRIEKADRSRTCYLPAGADWIDFWSGEYFTGGRDIERQTPLDRIPLFIKAGTILPVKEGMQYAEDKEGEPVILHIFPGSDGSFTLYEDEGNNYRYEQGEYLTISLNWKDKENILFIGGQKGSYHGSFAERDFIIRINGQKETVVRYRGDAVEIGLNR
ncbi:MAG: DUF5110 domain-containing protein [Lachnospiraceae bacterium]|nr:DUF5110 domain-containing protein [Lachnospiraceae bacterium]